MSPNGRGPTGQGNPGIAPDLDLRQGAMVRNAAMNFIGMALPKVVALIAIPFTIRLLGTDRFGILSLAFIVFGYFGFLDLGLSVATVRYIALALAEKKLEMVPKYLWTTTAFQFLIGVAGALTLAAASSLITGRILKIPAGLVPEARTTIVLLALSLPVVLVTASFRGALEAAQRFDLVNIIKAPSSMLSYIVPVAAAALGFGLPGIVLFLFIVRALTLAAYLFECFRVYPHLRVRFAIDKNAVKPILSFGLWVQLSNVVAPVLAYLERFVLGIVLTVQAVGFFTAPAEAVMSLAIIPNSLLVTLFPAFSALEGRRDEETKNRFFGLSVKILLLVSGLIAVVLIFYAGDVLTLWLGAEFAERCTQIFQIMTVLFFLNALANVPYSVLQGIGRADILAKLYLVELVVSVPLAWVLIRNWGLLGAALSWAARIVIETPFLFAVSMRLGRIKTDSLTGGRTGRAVLGLAGLAAAGILLKQAAWGKPAFAVIVIGFLAVTWAVILEAKERSWIRGQLRTLRARLSFR